MRPEGPKIEAESGSGVLGHGAASHQLGDLGKRCALPH